MADRKIEYLDLDEIKEDPRNPKGHAEDLIDESFEVHGFIEPGQLDERTGQLIGGHGRLHRLKARRDAGGAAPDGIQVDKKGRWLMPVVTGWASRDDDQAARALVVLNQAGAAGGWLREPLLALLGDLPTLEGTGFRSLDDLPPLPEAPFPAVGPQVAPYRPKRPPAASRRADVRIIQGDCVEVLAGLEAESVDAVICDPPYEIGFMGKSWDDSGVAYRPATWAAVLRVLKPGGHLLAFGGTRTYHRMGVAIEDAGFEVRDSIHWVYGQGFPKSLDIARVVNEAKPGVTCQCGARGDGDLRGMWSGVSDLSADAEAGEVSDVLEAVQRPGSGQGVGELRDGGAAEEDSGELREGGPAGSGESSVEGRGDLSASEGELRPGPLREGASVGEGDGSGGWVRDGASPGDGGVGGADADAVGDGPSRGPQSSEQRAGEPAAIPRQSIPQALRAWPRCGRCGLPILEGLGSALKPAHEPIIVARKSLIGSVAANVLEHGTGGLNVDGTRVGTEGGTTREGESTHLSPQGAFTTGHDVAEIDAGRWPPNVVLDESAAAEMDRQSGVSKSPDHPISYTRSTDGTKYGGPYRAGDDVAFENYGDEGGASRFFPVFKYEAKASTAERNAGLDHLETQFLATMGDGIGAREHNPEEPTAWVKNVHATVKPVELMRWLVRLVTPPGGMVLDPFAGSGTTLVAAVLEGFDAIGIELTGEYLPIIEGRVAWAHDQIEDGPPDL